MARIFEINKYAADQVAEAFNGKDCFDCMRPGTKYSDCSSLPVLGVKPNSAHQGPHSSHADQPGSGVRCGSGGRGRLGIISECIAGTAVRALAGK